MNEGSPAAPTPDGPGIEDAQPRGGLAQGRRLRLMALLAIAGLVALAIWLVVESLSDDGSDGSATETELTTEPVALSANGLATLAAATGSPVYWVGPGAAAKYELAQRAGGQVFLRYLPSGVQAGDPRGLLTVATYAVDNAFDVTSKIQGEVIRIPGGGIAVVSPDRPTSAYVAFPGVNYQIEVYDPDPAAVKRLITSGAVKPVSAPLATATARGPEAVSEDDLVALADKLGHPVYWAGPMSSRTYELTVTSDGHAFVRYLAASVEVGSPSEALTVGTYPVEGAYEVTKQGGTEADSGTVEAPDGRVGVYRTTSPLNVYVAFPGEDVQIEVYSPVAGVARTLVTQGKIVPVG